MVATALLCLSLNIYHEARGEPLEGQIAVAYVTHRRAKGDSSKYCQVVRSPGQFSWTQQRGVRVDKKSTAWKTAQAVAKSFLLFPDKTKGATHYHEKKVSPRWNRSLKRVASVGRHVFYRAKEST